MTVVTWKSMVFTWQVPFPDLYSRKVHILLPPEDIKLVSVKHTATLVQKGQSLLPFPCGCDHSFSTLVPTSCKGSSPRVLKKATRRNNCIQRLGLHYVPFKSASKPTCCIWYWHGNKSLVSFLTWQRYWLRKTVGRKGLIVRGCIRASEQQKRECTEQLTTHTHI